MAAKQVYLGLIVTLALVSGAVCEALDKVDNETNVQGTLT